MRRRGRRRPARYPAAGSRSCRTRCAPGPVRGASDSARSPAAAAGAGSSARRATSAPATADCPKKRSTSLASAAGRNRAVPGGSRCRLVQVAAAAVTAPTRTAARSIRKITSQRQRNPTHRTIAAGTRPAALASRSGTGHGASLTPWRTAPGRTKALRWPFPCPGTRSRRRSAGTPASAWWRPAARP